MPRIRTWIAAAAIVLLPACEATGPQDGAPVVIRFATTAAPSGANPSVNSAAGEFLLDGANGALALTDIHFIVDEFEMERVEDACEAQPGTSAGGGDEHDEDHDECEEFSAGPFFVGLDLGSEIPVVAQEVPAGTYTRLKFKVEDTELDDEDDDHHGSADMQALLQSIQAAGYTEWPSKASMVVSGTFTPTGGAARSFTAYFEAELKIRKNFDPPLDVTEDPSTITVDVDPSSWFRTSSGVLDLSAWDYATTHRVVEFEAKLGDGFRRARYDHD